MNSQAASAAGRKRFKAALAGNPNCGKTTIFNCLTGTRQHVGNYAGVTVESVSKEFSIGGNTIELIDIPGIYSLSSSSPEEEAAFQELTRPGIDLIINVVNCAALQRNLYLSTQLAELHIPMIIVFNMSDEAEQKGLVFDTAALSRALGSPIVKTVGSKGGGCRELCEQIQKILGDPEHHDMPKLNYGGDLNDAIQEISAQVEALQVQRFAHIPAKFFAIKLLEKDAAVLQLEEFSVLHSFVDSQIKHLHNTHAIEADTFMADSRYALISGICRTAVMTSREKSREISDAIDAVMTNRVLGLPLFFAIMYAVFWFTFTLAEGPMEGLENAFAALADAINGIWPAGRLEIIRAVITDGIIGGVGGVVIFLPNIVLMFLALAFLEDSGYMARAAFVIDGLMRKFGLHGKSFVPLVLGFGCTVPAIMATRSIESERDRKTTIMVLPLMSCGARLPIYLMIIPAFFTEHRALMMWTIYLIGVVLALFAARMLKSTLFKGGGEVFLMELPPYRCPTLRSVFLHMWERSVLYLHKAGTIILAASIVLFLANTYPQKTDFPPAAPADAALNASLPAADGQAAPGAAEKLTADRRAEMMEYTVSGRIGRAMEPLFRPVGFDWKICTALVGALAAKEVFVSQLGILYSAGVDAGDDHDAGQVLRTRLRANYTPLQGFCIMLFCLLSIPCLATIAIVRREFGSWAGALGQAAGMLALAYVLTFIVYNTGMLCGLGTKMLP